MNDFKAYKDLSGHGGITAYQFVPNGIILQFKHRELYLYDDSRPGKNHVEQMKALAKKGRGLTTYVNQHVRENYKRKLS